MTYSIVKGSKKEYEGLKGKKFYEVKLRLPKRYKMSNEEVKDLNHNHLINNHSLLLLRSPRGILTLWGFTYSKNKVNQDDFHEKMKKGFNRAYKRFTNQNDEN